MINKKIFNDFVKLYNSVLEEIDRVLLVLCTHNYPNADQFVANDFSYYVSDNGAEYGNFIAEGYDSWHDEHYNCRFPARFLFMTNDDIFQELHAWKEPGPIED